MRLIICLVTVRGLVRWNARQAETCSKNLRNVPRALIKRLNLTGRNSLSLSCDRESDRMRGQMRSFTRPGVKYCDCMSGLTCHSHPQKHQRSDGIVEVNVKRRLEHILLQ